jgi:hypothetical protein
LIAKSNGQALAENWTMADNSTFALDADTAIMMGVSVGQYVATLHERARVLRLAINVCETVEDLEAIDISIGWP